MGGASSVAVRLLDGLEAVDLAVVTSLLRHSLSHFAEEGPAMKVRRERHVGADFNIADAAEDETVLVPEGWGSVVAAQEDAAWFESRPGVNVRMRTTTPGEAATMPVSLGWRVVVYQLRPGFLAPPTGGER